MNNQFPEGDEQEPSIEKQVDLTKYENFLKQVLEGKEISHASVKKQIGRLISDLIDDYVAHSCVFYLEVPRDAYKSITSNVFAIYPRTLPISLLDYVRQTPLAANLSQLLEDKDYMFYALACYYFWQEIASRFRSFAFESPNDIVNPYLVISSNSVSFNPEMFDIDGVPKMMENLKEAKGHEYEDTSLEGNKRGRRDLRGRSNKEMEMVLFRERVKDQPELVEFTNIVLSAARERMILVSPDFIVNLSQHKYPRYIPFPVLLLLKDSKSKNLINLVQKHPYLFAAICWKILNVYSNSEFLFKYKESEGNLQYAIKDEEFRELDNYSGFLFEDGTYTGEQYIQSGVLQVFGIDLSIKQNEIDASVYGDSEDLENDADYEP